jgi:hypothetical protein
MTAATFPRDRIVEYRDRIDSFAYEGSQPGPEVEALELVWDAPMMRHPTGCPVRRPYIRCPCGRRARFSFPPRFRCRVCEQVESACRHELGGQAIHRVRRYRQLLRLSLEAFAPLPKIPQHHRRRRRLLERLMQAEVDLVDERLALVRKIRLEGSSKAASKRKPRGEDKQSQ